MLLERRIDLARGAKFELQGGPKLCFWGAKSTSLEAPNLSCRGAPNLRFGGRQIDLERGAKFEVQGAPKLCF